MSQYSHTAEKSFQASAALARYRRVRLGSSNTLEYAGAANTDCIGTLIQTCLAADEFVPVRLRNAEGTHILTASGAISKGAGVYAAANGKVASSGTVLVGEALEAAGADGDFIEVVLATTAVLGDIARAALTQDDLKPYPVAIRDLRVWDAPATVAVTTAASDDLAVTYNTFLTGSPTVETGDVKNTSTTRKIGFQVQVPIEYVAGETITMRLNAGMKTTVASSSATIDVECTRQAAPTVDLCTTAAQSINSLTAADKDFTITPTNVVPGELLDVVVTIAVVDSATGTAVIGKINTITPLFDVKG